MPITLSVPVELWNPIPAIGMRYPSLAAAAMLMLEATVNKDRLALFGENEVRCAWEGFAMEPETVTESVNELAA